MMMDNDFPMAMAGSGGSPYQPYVPPAGPSKPTQPAEGFEEFRKKHGIKKSSDPSGYLQEYVAGMQGYSQEGTDIPDLRVQTDYAQKSGGPLVSEAVAQGIPVGQDPIFPMSQEEFSDWVRTSIGRKQPYIAPPARIRDRIDALRAKYGIGGV